MTPSLPSTRPDIRLYGQVDVSMLGEFLRQQAEAPTGRPLVMEFSTPGGDADLGRRIAQEIRQWRNEGCDLYFFGKSFVYSAGISILGAFPRHRRFVSSDCELLVHERKLQTHVRLDGSLKACATQIKNTLAEIESGQRLELDGFEAFVEGSSITVTDLQDHVCERDWYLPAHEALRLGLVAGIVH